MTFVIFFAVRIVRALVYSHCFCLIASGLEYQLHKGPFIPNGSNAAMTPVILFATLFWSDPIVFYESSIY